MKLIGEVYSSCFVKIDVDKVCDDHYDSQCMRGRCEICSPEAATFNQERWDYIQKVKKERKGSNI